LGLAFRSKFRENNYFVTAMRFFRPIGIGLLLLAAQLCASASDLAVLKNGSTIPFLRKEEIGTVTRLYIPGGHLDIPTSQIASYDKDDSPLDDVTSDSQPAPSNPAATTAPKAQTSAQTAQASPAAANAQPVSMTAAAHTRSVEATKSDIDDFVREAASKYQLDPDFVASVIKAESDFNPHAVSPKGARGLMQLMPQTASQLGVKDVFDPQANVEAGTAHLSDLLDQYHNDPIKALAAYNAGAHRVKQYHGVPPYRETRAYVAKIVRDFNARKRAEMKAAAKAPANKIAQKTKSSPKLHKSQPQHASAAKAQGDLVAAE
jgi:soluble lytic murein transglycosylase-like protein